MLDKIGYIGIFNEVVTSQSYHNFGWTNANMEQLKTIANRVEILNWKSDLNAWRYLFIDEGVNFSGESWNKIGGDFSKVIPKLEKLNNYRGICFHNKLREFPDYFDLIKKRKELAHLTYTPQFEIKSIDFIKTKLILGDSHATSVMSPNWAVNSINGKTLFSFLRDGIKTFIPDSVEHLRFYAGNIDIRFHWTRLNQDLNIVALELETQLKSLGIKIDLVQPLPIDPETRKQSSTMGSYLGRPYWGTFQERKINRDIWSNLLREMCSRNNWTYLEWPETITDANGALRIECMEPKRGPHLNPRFYMNIKNN